MRQITTKEIFNKINTQMKRSNTRFTLIFDLDDTLFDTSYRRYFIYEQFLRPKYELPKLSLNLLKKCYNFLPLLEENYYFRKNHTNIVEDFLKLFLSRPCLYFDRPFSGTISFFNQIRNPKIRVVFLTGRHNATMKTGTILLLKIYGFIYQGFNRHFLVMKKNDKLSDGYFKIRELKHIMELFPKETFVIFDNESENCKLFEEILPNNAIIVRYNSVQKKDCHFNGFFLENWEF
ncbi:MAG: hypothetical protein HWN65_07040 [Candidatus Helarchaeota archaeon]|nr:hypothetical protein [Candidatus Helarchaeota archaeon]